jgi:uroporphyrinogen-III synthase
MPTAEPPLAGVRVLVTRPASRARRLSALIEEAGGSPIAFPTLAIVPVDPAGDEIDAMAASDIVVFVSANAVEHGYDFLRQRGTSAKQIVPIGRATMKALADAGCKEVHDPGEHSSSEDLLAQPVLENVSGRRVCIVRGRGGRELLKDTLMARGARVSYLECYRRALPGQPDIGALDRALAAPASLVVTSTSASGLDNLLALAPPRVRDQLLARPLVVIGERQQNAARNSGWVGPVMTAPAGDRQLVDRIVAWRAEQSETAD